MLSKTPVTRCGGCVQIDSEVDLTWCCLLRLSKWAERFDSWREVKCFRAVQRSGTLNPPPPPRHRRRRRRHRHHHHHHHHLHLIVVVVVVVVIIPNHFRIPSPYGQDEQPVGAVSSFLLSDVAGLKDPQAVEKSKKSDKGSPASATFHSSDSSVC